MLFDPAAVLLSIRQRRCVKSYRPLLDDENLLSRSAVPALYSLREDKKEQQYISGLLKPLAWLLRSDHVGPDERTAIKLFMMRVVAHGGMGKEAYVHQLLFDFWNELWADPHERVEMVEKYFEGEIYGAEDLRTPFASNVVPLVTRDHSYPDIIGRGGYAGRDVIIAEVKLDTIDDRAIGQILRYYSLLRRAIDHYPHGCDLRRIVPILIVQESSQTKYWEAFPEHFREFLIICFYRIAGQRVYLHDARKEMLSWTRQARLRSGHALS